MHFHLKPLATLAVACTLPLAAWAKSPLDALGGSTFDISSKTGAVSLERLRASIDKEAEAERFLAPRRTPAPTPKEIAAMLKAFRNGEGIEFVYTVNKRVKERCDGSATQVGGQPAQAARLIEALPPVETLPPAGTLPPASDPTKECLVTSSQFTPLMFRFERGVGNGVFVLAGPRVSTDESTMAARRTALMDDEFQPGLCEVKDRGLQGALRHREQLIEDVIHAKKDAYVSFELRAFPRPVRQALPDGYALQGLSAANAFDQTVRGCGVVVWQAVVPLGDSKLLDTK